MVIGKMELEAPKQLGELVLPNQMSHYNFQSEFCPTEEKTIECMKMTLASPKCFYPWLLHHPLCDEAQTLCSPGHLLQVISQFVISVSS